MPSQWLGRRWLPLAIGALITLRSVMQKDRMAQNRQMLNFYPGIVAVELRQFLPAPTTLPVLQAAFQGDLQISIRTDFDLEHVYILNVQGY